jgi:hypothetical protein
VSALQERPYRNELRDLHLAVDDDRSQLEALRLHYLDRLHRASDDFAATEGLRIVERALALVPRTHDDSAWQDRVRRSSTRERPKRS